MPSNRGQTSLKIRPNAKGGMREFDKLPAELRTWLATAILPWRPGSVAPLYARALSRTGDPQQALSELDKLQSRQVQKDACAVWGRAHPHAQNHG